jgi:CxxC-x17-CxxC domain-containing protein
MAYQDITLQCRDCGNDFAFTAGEQQFYSERGLTNQPGRCPDCRRAAKSSRGGGGGYGDRSYGDGGGGGGYSSRGGGGAREMYSVTCADCGRETQVPFRPTNGRPVYCNDCFPNHRPARY